jgi:hypothetical protein
MGKRELELFEAVAGERLSELGYERVAVHPSGFTRARARLWRWAIDARIASWHAALRVVRRSLLWKLRQVYIRRTSRDSPI